MNDRLEKSMRPWKDLTATEFYAFIGLVLHAGAEKDNLVEAKDLFSKRATAIYRATMSLERIEQILRFLTRLREDKLASIRYIWTVSLQNYHPSRELCIDEQC